MKSVKRIVLQRPTRQWDDVIAVIPRYEEGVGDVAEVWTSTDKTVHKISVHAILKAILDEQRLEKKALRAVYQTHTFLRNETAIPIGAKYTLVAIKMRRGIVPGDSTRGWIACECVKEIEQRGKGCMIYFMEDRGSLMSEWSLTTVGRKIAAGKHFRLSWDQEESAKQAD